MMKPTSGEALPVLEWKLDLSNLVTYAGATWDWHRWHYDSALAAAAKLPGPIVDGQILGALLARQASAWAGPRCRIRHMKFRFKSMVFAGETVRCESEVTSAARVNDALIVSLTQQVLVGERIVIDSASLELEVPL
jgi:acyl dehydratase